MRGVFWDHYFQFCAKEGVGRKRLTSWCLAAKRERMPSRIPGSGVLAGEDGEIFVVGRAGADRGAGRIKSED